MLALITSADIADKDWRRALRLIGSLGLSFDLQVGRLSYCTQPGWSNRFQ